MIPSILARRGREMILDYLRTTFSPADSEFGERLFGFLDGPGGLFRGPYLDLRLPFSRAPGGSHIPLEYAPRFRPYAHQVESFLRLSSMGDREPRSTLVTTGTGSGKTECFLYPILDHCLRHRDKPGVKAILIYPMNALANDQARRIAKELWTSPELKGSVSAGMYIGGRGEHAATGPTHLVDERSALRSSPPDILLTNYRMLDFLLLRPEDRALWRHNTPDTLRYLVLDELHTYDGAQGTDVACLVRRLKARLGMQPGRLCCVGTSATLGSESRDDAARALVGFAEKIFGEDIGGDSVVTEERMSVLEALGDTVDIDRHPPASAKHELDPDHAARPEEWLKRQARLWLGDDAADLSPVEIGTRLQRHRFLRLLLQALGGQPRTLGEVSGSISSLDAAFRLHPPQGQIRRIESFLGLIAFARRPAGTDGSADNLEPFLTLQMHLWIRELRRLLVRVGPTGCGYSGNGDEGLPSFAWHDQLATGVDDAGDAPCAVAAAPRGRGTHWLPLAWCRDCGAFGLASYLRQGRLQLQTDVREIGEAWLERSEHCRFLSLGSVQPGETQSYLCPACLILTHNEACRCQPGIPLKGLPVRVSRDHSQATQGERPRFLARCPECEASRQLSLLGSRAPSLLSVVLSNYYSDPYNSDRRMLAFTDSVQDASHRAGFFAGRTYRFNLRRAIQVFLESTKDDVPMMEAAGRVIEHWHRNAGEPERLGIPRLVAALVPPDLRHLDSYQAFLESRSETIPKRLERDLLTRLSWEIVMEYGLAVRAGRTLEETLCSTVRFDPAILDDVAAKLALDIREEGMLKSAPASGIPPESIRYWLSMLLLRWRRKGGIVHELLRPYFRSRGNSYLLRKHANPLLSPFSGDSILPVFVTSGPAPERRTYQTLESVISQAGRQTWYRDWAGRALGIDSRDEGMNELHRLTLRRLLNAGILESHADGGAEVFGIRPAAPNLTRNLQGMECTTCRRRWVFPREDAASQAGAVCPAFRCTGALSPVPKEPGEYYANLYSRGRLERIFPGEHTGLLTRTQREGIEERFKSGASPDGPNMIVCTPTLEMGIDVGDLSGVMLCSVPPAPSNFLQRVGRAGRRTGNSLCFAMVLTRPHDLYFHAEPTEMMAGTVFPPGCFLDAPEILYRQMAAHAMDQWAMRENSVPGLPPDAARCLSESGWASFPGSFLEFLERNREEILASFLTLFGPSLSEHNRERMRSFSATGAVSARIRGAFESIRTEQRELRSLLKRARQRLRELELNPDLSEQPEADRSDLDETIEIIQRLIDELGSKYPLNVLTDAGVIPNYAFPEPGVVLDSVITERGTDGQSRHKVYNFQRPASSAIREFAPFNTFYADGRRVRVDEIDLGPRQQPLLEDWRFCPECNHMRRVAQEEAIEPSCPRCNDPGWSDAGQVRSLVLFRKARSLTPVHEAGSVDDSDDRTETRYRLIDLVETSPENRSGAWAINTLPFGYELLRGQILRQVNFGRTAGGSEPVRVAGSVVQAPGFDVCLRCGRVRDEETINHAPHCPSRRNGRQEKTRRVFLYREVKSEALRILLPVAGFGVDTARASFQAALDLGFRRHFQGSPGHLAMTHQREPAEGGGQRNFLVVFDAVPGGSGYLAELVHGDKLFEVLRLALQALTACTCRQDPLRDGCYLCLYGYRSAYQRDLTSSRCAEQMLTRILGSREDCVQVDTLSTVSMADRMESELEIHFLNALESRIHTTEGASWERLPDRGEYVYRLRFGGAANGGARGGPVWTIRPQVELGSAEGVHPSCRPDFLMELDCGTASSGGSSIACSGGSASAGSGDRSTASSGGRASAGYAGASAQRPLAVAVFCDGLAWHVRPDDAEGGIGDDIVKRRGLLRSGRYRVWSVTWDDVVDFGKREDHLPGGLLSDADIPKARQLFEALLTRGSGRLGEAAHAAHAAHAAPGRAFHDLHNIARLSSMELLFRFLQYPDTDIWTRLVQASAAIWLTDGRNLREGQIEDLEHRLEEEPARFRVPVAADGPSGANSGAGRPDVPGRLHQGDWFSALVRCPARDLTSGNLALMRIWLRLFDEKEGRESQSFRESWRAFLQAWNLLQFCPGHIAASSECLPGVYGAGSLHAEAADAAGSSADSGTASPARACHDAGDTGVTAESDAALRELLELSPRRSGGLISAAHDAGFGLPALDHEIPGRSGRVGPEAEMAWVDRRVAILSESQAQDREAFKGAGWVVLIQPVEAEALIPALRRATGAEETEE